ncbi:MAG: ABC transporter ATP-binding protein [Eggerthellaceae bacterium]|nr:ABC transporter ATP-binding protein [Eggerthellaceae bacterium]
MREIVSRETHPHEAISHETAHTHHHHSHAHDSRHDHGHHLLQVEHLSVSFRMYDSEAPFFQAKQREVRVVENLSISVHAGEIVAVVGASGSGKTLLADAVMGLYEPNSLVTGTVWFDGRRMDAASLTAMRGNGLSLVPQSVGSLDPLMKVGAQVEEWGTQGPCGSKPSLRASKARADRRDSRFRSERHARRQELFERYGLAEEVAQLYPHQLSGGMARRVLLCCALMDNPKVIVADEPTPGLDLKLAVRAMEDFRAFANQGGGVLLITHDIELALSVADRVAVFKDGTVVEETAVTNFASPDLLEHPFSRALWHALPERDFSVREGSSGDSGNASESPSSQALAPDSPSTLRSCGTRASRSDSPRSREELRANLLGESSSGDSEASSDSKEERC